MALFLLVVDACILPYTFCSDRYSTVKFIDTIAKRPGKRHAMPNWTCTGLLHHVVDPHVIDKELISRRRSSLQLGHALSGHAVVAVPLGLC